MPEKNDYSQFIEHMGDWILDLPDSEFLTRLMEVGLTAEANRSGLVFQ